MSKLVRTCRTNNQNTGLAGEPPRSARAFHDWLATADADSCGGVRYAVFANGNTDYQKFNHFGAYVDELLAARGATRLLEAKLGDSSASKGGDAALAAGFDARLH